MTSTQNKCSRVSFSTSKFSLLLRDGSIWNKKHIQPKRLFNINLISLWSYLKRGRLGYDGRLPSFRSVPSSGGEVAEIARSVRIKVAGRVGFADQTRSILFLSLSLSRASLSFLFWKPASHFPFKESGFFFFLFSFFFALKLNTN